MVPCSHIPAIHIFALVLGSLEIVLFGGVIFGWHSVVYIYKENNYFNHLCPNFNSANSTNLTLSSAGSMINTSHMFASTSTLTVRNNKSQPTQGDVFNFPKSFNVSGDEQIEASIHFGDITCEEHMLVQSQKDGGVKVCKAQDEQFTLIFSLATGVNGVLSFPSGVMYDRLGTRFSRIISIVSFIAGQFCLIFASSSQPYLLYPGFMCLVYGGYQILLTNLQLAALVPSLRSTIMSLYSGSYDTSASILLLFKAAYEGGISINACFTVHFILYILIISSSTFFFLPATHIPSLSIPGYRLRCYLCHMFGKRKALRNCKPLTSHEWKVDENGSLILTSAISNDTLNSDHENTGKDVRSTHLHDTVKKSPLSENHDSAKTGHQISTSVDATITEEAATVNESGKHQYPVQDLETVKLNGTVDTVMENGSDGIGAGETCDIKLNPVSAPEIDPRETDNHDTTERLEMGVKTLSQGEGESMIKSVKKKTFKQVVLSKLFLTDLLWISVHRLRSWIFVGMFNSWITRLVCGDKALVSHYTSAYAGLQFFGILTAPFSGQLMDRKIKGVEKYGNPRYERLHASIASFVLNSTVAVLLTICTLIPVHQLQYLTFVLHCLHRSFLYGPNSAFVANAFPNEHFGKLFGVTLTVSAIFSMLQYPLFIIMQEYLHGDPMAINIFLLVLILISFTHPICIWRYLQKKLAKGVQAQ